MMPNESVNRASCLTCGAVIGEDCKLLRREGWSPGVHYTRWNRVLGENHDPGDEDRNTL